MIEDKSLLVEPTWGELFSSPFLLLDFCGRIFIALIVFGLVCMVIAQKAKKDEEK